MLKRLLILLSFTLAHPVAYGCGLDWTLPTSHFDGVEEHGYVSYWEKIGEVDVGNGLVIPVNINFNSHRESASPTLGKGWMVALLESHVEPVDENHLRVIMPDGWNFDFLRNGNAETWRGNGGWVGETNDTLFTITAPCGWKIKFDGGKIQEITTSKNQTLTYRYNGGIATELDAGNTVLVKIESETGTVVPSGLIIGDGKVVLTMAQRPRVMAKLNQNLITGFDLCLQQFQWPNGMTETFGFGTDKSLNPNLTITNTDKSQRTLSWDPVSHKVLLDGDWTYSLSKVDDNSYPEFTRTNSAGKTEYYSDDPGAGITVVQGIDGVRQTTLRFANAGDLSSQIRKITQTSNGITTVVYQGSYDETGRLIRTVDGRGAIATYQYDSNGNISAVCKLGTEILWQTVIAGNQTIEQKSSDGTRSELYPRSLWEKNTSLLGRLTQVRPGLMDKVEFLKINQHSLQYDRELEDVHHCILAAIDVSGRLWEFVSGLKENVMYVNGNKYSEDILDAQGRVSERHQFSGASTEPNEIQTFTYDGKNRVIKIVTVDKKPKQKITLTLAYDDKSRIIEHKSSLTGTYEYTYLPSGERKQRFIPPPDISSQN